MVDARSKIAQKLGVDKYDFQLMLPNARLLDASDDAYTMEEVFSSEPPKERRQAGDGRAGRVTFLQRTSRRAASGFAQTATVRAQFEL